MKSTLRNRSKKFDQNTQAPLSLDIDRTHFIGGNGKTCDKLRLAMWNVNGIRSVMNNKRKMRDLIQKCEPHFICINETKINEENFRKERIKIDGYKDYWNFCKCSSGYSGVAVFSKFIPISMKEDMEEPEYSQEGRILTLEYQLFYLVVIYMPSVGSKKPGDKDHDRLDFKTKKYMVAFEKHCQDLKSKGKGVIIAGDMNICHEEIDIYFTNYSYLQPGFTGDERRAFKKFLNLGWVDTFRHLHPEQRVFTWWKVEYGNREKNIGKRLDYFLVSKDFLNVVTKSEIFGDILGSDHCPIFMAIDLSKIEQKQEEKKIQTVEIKNEEQVCDSLKNFLEKEGVIEGEKEVREEKEQLKRNCMVQKQAQEEVKELRLPSEQKQQSTSLKDEDKQRGNKAETEATKAQ